MIGSSWENTSPCSNTRCLGVTRGSAHRGLRADSGVRARRRDAVVFSWTPGAQCDGARRGARQLAALCLPAPVDGLSRVFPAQKVQWPAGTTRLHHEGGQYASLTRPGTGRVGVSAAFDVWVRSRCGSAANRPQSRCTRGKRNNEAILGQDGEHLRALGDGQRARRRRPLAWWRWRLGTPSRTLLGRACDAETLAQRAQPKHHTAVPGDGLHHRAAQIQPSRSAQCFWIT